MSRPVTVENEHPALTFIVELFGATTELPVFFQTLPNDDGDPDEGRIRIPLLTRELNSLVRFITKYDRNRRALYFCVATLEPGARTRNKENARESIGLHLDIDFKHLKETEPEIRQLLATLLCPPTALVRSGGGLHLYWLFKESLPTQANQERLEEALRALAGLLGGDPAVCHVAALMRLPGTTNSKYGDQRTVVCEFLDGPRYELDDLEDWIAETEPILQFIPDPAKNVVQKLNPGAGPESAVPTDPWEALAAEIGHRTAADVGRLLAEMAPGNVHVTQRSVSASLIYHGHPVEEVVETVLAATQEAMGTAGARWNWQREQRKIRRMCVTAVAKVETWSRQRARPSPRPAAPVETPPEDDGGTEGPPDGSKESLEESVSRETKESLESTPEAPKPALKLVASNDGKGAGKGKEQGDAKVKQKPRQVSSVHLVLADATLKVMRQRGQDLMFTREGDYRYGSGLWHLEGDRDMKRWLDMLLEEGAHGLKMESSNRLIREAREYLMRLPELHRDDIRFDAHGKIPTLSGLVDPRTGEVTPAKPEHYCRWQIPYAYDPDATCPLWLQMQEDVFADRSVEVRAAHVGLLQELLGAGLIDLKPKGLMRALVLVGGSDFGKSGLLDVMAGLYGRQHNATSMDALNGPHGLMPFISRVPWLLHEAFDAGRWHLSGVVKALISGDAIQINIKGSKIFTHHFTAPAFWGANSAPNFKEATDAIVNRLVVVECKRKFYPDEPVGVAAFARERGFEKPQHLVLATEMSGVLTWAVEGLRRALARGYFELPEESKAAAENVRIDSNLVAGFIRDCVEFDPSNMVSTPDFSAAFASWWLENKGEDSGIPRAERIGWAIKALGDPRIAVDRNEIRLTSRRYYAGISLNADGRRHWSNTTSSDAFVFQGRTTNTSTEIADVNKMIPVDWDAKPMIQAMRAAYDKMAK